MPLRSVIYLGFNDPRKHTRGTENVIRLQSSATDVLRYYVFRSDCFVVFKWGKIIAVGCPSSLLFAGFFILRLVNRIRSKYGASIIFHGHSYLLSAIAFSAPLVFTVHDALKYQKKHVGAKHLWIFEKLERFVYWRAKKIHSISNYTWTQACSNSQSSAKVIFIPNSIASDVVCHETKNETPFLSHSPKYLIVRSIEERANFDLVFRFAKHCMLHEPGAMILVAGKGPLLSYYKDLVFKKKLTNIIFLGYVSDAKLNSLYHDADCLIMPAVYGEGFGLPLIEAYSRGIPAVGSNVCAVPEVIADTSLLFDNNLPQLLSAIKSSFKISRSYYLMHFNRNFSRKKILKQYKNFYESIFDYI